MFSVLMYSNALHSQELHYERCVYVHVFVRY